MGDGGSVFIDDDDSGFDAFYRSTCRPLLGQLYAMCGDMDEAQDCLQEAYLRAWQRWPRISQYKDPAGWVRQVAWRLAINRWHRARNAVRAWVRHGPAPAVAEASPDGLLLAAAMRGLPVAQREALVLHYLAGMTIEQIADQTGAPAGTIKARLARGRTHLSELLSEEAIG
jgi:RNA polymerase sigma-70 factor (ECF subfamily)